MRPQGTIRRALLEAATRLYDERGGATWPVIAAEAQVSVPASDSIAGETTQRGIAAKVAKVTINNLVRAGELEIIGSEKPAGSNLWHAIYAPVQTPLDASRTVEPSQRLSKLLTEVQAFG